MFNTLIAWPAFYLQLHPEFVAIATFARRAAQAQTKTQRSAATR
jgi:hypothetical protein